MVRTNSKNTTYWSPNLMNKLMDNLARIVSIGAVRVPHHLNCRTCNFQGPG